MGLTNLKDYAKFDARFTEQALSPNKATVRLGYYVPNWYYDGTEVIPESTNWLAEKRKSAELEAHRERVRQIYAKSFGAARQSAEWAQGLQYIQNAQTIERLKQVCDSFDIVWKDEGDMVTKNDEINALKSKIAELNAKVEKLEHGRLGKEPANGTVLKVEKRFSENGPKYVYAAVRANGMWYLTGTVGAGIREYTWETLKEFVGKYSRVWLMGASKEFVD